MSPSVNRIYEYSLPSKSPTRVAAGAHASRDRRETGFWQEASTQGKKLTTVYFQSPESVFGVTVTDFTSTYDATPYSTANWLCFKVSNFKDIQMVSVCPIFVLDPIQENCLEAELDPPPPQTEPKVRHKRRRCGCHITGRQESLTPAQKLESM